MQTVFYRCSVERLAEFVKSRNHTSTTQTTVRPDVPYQPTMPPPFGPPLVDAAARERERKERVAR